ncbi:hypothetical protein CEXT_209891 [Caerostris extrusa]|uniref:Uncharacterized protein n=1 Tax=Caerostris extrusa TaxID=172846 RepID=A0AAV4WWF9_CAEEX|nr:hypothetical protein CEXT_209891 [Caerostris extrusa]
MHLKHFLVTIVISSTISISTVSCRRIDSNNQPTDGNTTELTSEIAVLNSTKEIETPLVLQSSSDGESKNLAVTIASPIAGLIWLVCCCYCIRKCCCQKNTQNVVIMNQNTTAAPAPAAPQIILQQPIINQNMTAPAQQVPMQQWAPQQPPQQWAPQPPPQQFGGLPNITMKA